jgi:glutamate-1-semialdehyde 2,1-aminomutase
MAAGHFWEFLMQHLVGGISSAGRALPALNDRAFRVDHAYGPYIVSDDGRRYVDTALGFGAILLGHADPVVNAAVCAAVERGSMPAFAHRGEEKAAELLTAACGPLSSAMFTNSGSEAVHMACRIARAITGRGTIAKIAAGFDGWLDPMALGNAGSQDALLGNGPRPVRNGVTLLRYNDIADIERLFQENDDIAAVIFEPLLANAGCVVAEPDYLEMLQATARRHGALLIADEVLMGFRSRFGVASHGMKLNPDMATVGKAIGNGFAVAAVLGQPEVMAAAADGRAVRAGTYSGNPVATAAVVATLEQLAKADYEALAARGERLRACLASTFAAQSQQISTSGLGMVFTPWFAGEAPRSYEAAAATIRPDKSLALHYALREQGVMTMPQGYGRLYLSFAHDDAVIEQMEGAIRLAATALRED